MSRDRLVDRRAVCERPHMSGALDGQGATLGKGRRKEGYDPTGRSGRPGTTQKQGRRGHDRVGGCGSAVVNQRHDLEEDLAPDAQERAATRLRHAPPGARPVPVVDEDLEPGVAAAAHIIGEERIPARAFQIGETLRIARSVEHSEGDGVIGGNGKNAAGNPAGQCHGQQATVGMADDMYRLRKSSNDALQSIDILR